MASPSSVRYHRPCPMQSARRSILTCRKSKNCWRSLCRACSFAASLLTNCMTHSPTALEKAPPSRVRRRGLIVEAGGIEPPSRDDPNNRFYMRSRLFVVIPLGGNRQPSRGSSLLFLIRRRQPASQDQPLFTFNAAEASALTRAA